MKSNSSSATNPIPRRQFLGKSVTLGGGLGAGFFISSCQRSKKPVRRSSGVFVGDGEHRYEVIHDWCTLPEPYTWQTSHNVAVDSNNQLYVIHEGRADQPDHPSIFVFDEKGVFVRAFGNEFQGGGHGLEVRQEGNEEFLYVTGYQHLKNFKKMTLTGETVWEKRAPMDSGIYAEGEDTKPEKVWGRDRFMPTNFAFLEDGGFILADGYGGHCLHRYDADGNWQAQIGKSGKSDGEFNLPHGLWIDKRSGKETIVVADRANARLQWFSLDGAHLKTLNDFILPANVDSHDDLLLVPDLSARITLVDTEDRLIHLGEDDAWRKDVLKDGKKMRKTPEDWVSGKFVHPHDACFDQFGDIFVAEWVHSGRITKLQKV